MHNASRNNNNNIVSALDLIYYQKKQETSKLEAILQARKCNRERQCRYRSKLSDGQKLLIRENDRNTKRLKRNQKLIHFNDDDTTDNKAIPCNISDLIKNC
jgi:hypothetical protein